MERPHTADIIRHSVSSSAQYKCSFKQSATTNSHEHRFITEAWIILLSDVWLLKIKVLCSTVESSVELAIWFLKKRDFIIDIFRSLYWFLRFFKPQWFSKSVVLSGFCSELYNLFKMLSVAKLHPVIQQTVNLNHVYLILNLVKTHRQTLSVTNSNDLWGKN